MSDPSPAVHIGRNIVMKAETEQEPGHLITRQEFLLICEGEDSGSARATRDVSIGVFFSAVLGLAAFTTTMPNAPSPSWVVLLACFVGVTLASLTLGIFFHVQSKKHAGRRSYQECLQSIRDHLQIEEKS